MERLIYIAVAMFLFQCSSHVTEEKLNLEYLSHCSKIYISDYGYLVSAMPKIEGEGTDFIELYDRDMKLVERVPNYLGSTPSVIDWNSKNILMDFYTMDTIDQLPKHSFISLYNKFSADHKKIGKYDVSFTYTFLSGISRQDTIMFDSFLVDKANKHIIFVPISGNQVVIPLNEIVFDYGDLYFQKKHLYHLTTYHILPKDKNVLNNFYSVFFDSISK